MKYVPSVQGVTWWCHLSYFASPLCVALFAVTALGCCDDVCGAQPRDRLDVCSVWQATAGLLFCNELVTTLAWCDDVCGAQPRDRLDVCSVWQECDRRTLLQRAVMFFFVLFPVKCDLSYDTSQQAIYVYIYTVLTSQIYACLVSVLGFLFYKNKLMLYQALCSR